MDHYWQTVDGGFWFKPAYEKLFAALPNDRASVWVEVGVFHGSSLCWLGVEIINSGKPVTIYAVDDFRGWPGVAQGDVLRDSFLRSTQQINQLLGDQFEVCMKDSLTASRLFAEASCDVVWLDADHSYEGVKADIAAWWPKVKVGGTLGGDDWHQREFPGVVRAVDEAFTFPLHVVVGIGHRPGYGDWPYWTVQKPA